MEAGLDPMSASTRMNRYELGKRAPNFELVEAFASVLGVPAPYFYAADDTLAEVILRFGKMPPEERAQVIELIGPRRHRRRVAGKLLPERL